MHRLRAPAALASAVLLFSSADFDNRPSLVRQPVLDCYGCTQCHHPDYSVPAVSTEPDTWWIDFMFYCPQNPWSEPCSELPECIPPSAQEQLLASVESAVKDETGKALATLLAGNDRLRLVPERSAVQILSCQGPSVRAHIPVENTTVDRVLALQAIE